VCLVLEVLQDQLEHQRAQPHHDVGGDRQGDGEVLARIGLEQTTRETGVSLETALKLRFQQKSSRIEIRGWIINVPKDN
jgi:hypothetical protein